MTEIGVIPPAKYWRESRSWPAYLGLQGKVLAATLISFGLPELERNTPYWLVLVEHKGASPVKTRLYLGSSGFDFHRGDNVVCVLKRISSGERGLIHYGLKVEPARTGKPESTEAPAKAGAR